MILIDPPLVPSRGRMWSPGQRRHATSCTPSPASSASPSAASTDRYDVAGEWYDEAVAGACRSHRELIVRLHDAGRRRKRGRPHPTPRRSDART
jgi:hypothetical protein